MDELDTRAGGAANQNLYELLASMNFGDEQLRQAQGALDPTSREALAPIAAALGRVVNGEDTGYLQLKEMLDRAGEFDDACRAQTQEFPAPEFEIRKSPSPLHRPSFLRRAGGIAARAVTGMMHERARGRHRLGPRWMQVVGLCHPV